MMGDNREGNTDLPRTGDGDGGGVGLLAADGFRSVAHEIDGDALDYFGG